MPTGVAVPAASSGVRFSSPHLRYHTELWDNVALRGPRFPNFGNIRRLNAGWVWDIGEGFLLKDQREESL